MIAYRWYLYKTHIRGYKFTFKFRGATRRELATAGGFKTNWEAEKFIFKAVVENGENIDFGSLPAGVVETLLSKIYYYTGITTPQYTWEQARNWIESEEGQFEVMAMSVFPWCSKEYLDNCDPLYYAQTLVAGRYCFETALSGYQQPSGQTSSSNKTALSDNRDLYTSTETVKFNN